MKWLVLQLHFGLTTHVTTKTDSIDVSWIGSDMIVRSPSDTMKSLTNNINSINGRTGCDMIVKPPSDTMKSIQRITYHGTIR